MFNIYQRYTSKTAKII